MAEHVFYNDINLTDNELLNFIVQKYTLTADIPDLQGKLAYSLEDNTLYLCTGSGIIEWSSSTSETSKEIFQVGLNNTGIQINNGQVVYVNGTSSGILTVGLSQANDLSKVISVAVATHDIPNGSLGKFTQIGEVKDFDLSSFNNLDILYVSPTVEGWYTSIKPSDPNYICPVGIVISNDAVTGIFNVKPRGVILSSDVSDAGWSSFFGINTRVSDSILQITGTDVTYWKGFGIRINNIYYGFISNAIISGSDTLLTIEGAGAIPVTITDIRLKKTGAIVIQAEFLPESFNIVTDSILGDERNKTQIYYKGTKGHIARLRVYHEDLGVNTNNGTWNATLNGLDLMTADKELSDIILTSGLLTVGTKYKISNITGGADFLNVGAATGALGEIFTATATTPTSWGTGSLTQYTFIYATSGITVQNEEIEHLYLDSNLNEIVAEIKIEVVSGTGSDDISNGYVEIIIIEE